MNPSASTHVLVRGQVLHFVADPGPADAPAAWQYFDDGALWISDGHIHAAGPWSDISAALPPGIRHAATLHDHRADLHLPGPVAVLTQLRTFGWLFNPLTTYYCFEPDGQTLAALVLEITNTPWHERFWYVLDAQQVDGRGLPFPKQFHVSPLLPMDLSYRCRAPVPGDRLALRFELSSGGAPIPSGDSAEGAASTNASTRVFDADLTGRRVSLDAPLTLRPALRSATQTALVSGGIYAHAASLRLRGAPFHRHPKHDDSPHTPRGALDPRTSP